MDEGLCPGLRGNVPFVVGGTWRPDSEESILGLVENDDKPRFLILWVLVGQRPGGHETTYLSRKS